MQEHTWWKVEVEEVSGRAECGDHDPVSLHVLQHRTPEVSRGPRGRPETVLYDNLRYGLYPTVSEVQTERPRLQVTLLDEGVEKLLDIQVSSAVNTHGITYNIPKPPLSDTIHHLDHPKLVYMFYGKYINDAELGNTDKWKNKNMENINIRQFFGKRIHSKTFLAMKYKFSSEKYKW